MTKTEWFSLEKGSVVCNQKNKNHRAVLSANGNGAIRLPSDRTTRGYTVYCSGDKYMFNLVKIKIRIKKK